MKSKFSSQAGMSLVEATIILLVLAVLTAVIAPSAGDYVSDVRQVKAKEDVEALGTGILRLVRDIGYPCLTSTGQSAFACNGSIRRELLTSSDAVGTNEPRVTAAAFTSVIANTALSNASLNWAGGTNEVDDLFRDLMDNQLVTNTLTGASNYRDVSFTSRATAGRGWRGAYVSGPVGLDPWGFAYQASTAFLGAAWDSTGAATIDGVKGWSADVVVISAGPDGSIATLFGDESTEAVGDDVIYVMRGATR